MNRKVFIFVALIAALAGFVLSAVLSCSQDPEPVEIINALSGKDCSAPVLLSVRSETSSLVRLEFDEPVKVFGSSFGSSTARADGRFIYVSLPDSLPPGETSTVSGRVKDYAGNTAGFSISVWGFNPRLPETVINEFTTKGTAKSPSRTELCVLEDGNLNGMVLYAGTPDEYDAFVMLGDIEVKRGDLVVIWWMEELPDGIMKRLPGLWNICSAGAQKPASNNGTFVLCENPSAGAAILDAVVYSNFSQSHEGFGTKSALQRAVWVISAGAWTGEAVDGTASTATRSVSRRMNASDSDSCSDWYVTVTSGATFGSVNSSDAFAGN